MALALLVAAAGAAHGAELRARDFGSYGRIVLDWGEPAGYAVETSGDAVVVVLDRALDLDDAEAALAAATDALGPYLSAVRLEADGRRLVLVPAVPLRVNDLPTGRGVLLDVWPRSDGAAEVDEPRLSLAPPPSGSGRTDGDGDAAAAGSGATVVTAPVPGAASGDADASEDAAAAAEEAPPPGPAAPGQIASTGAEGRRGASAPGQIAALASAAPGAAPPDRSASGADADPPGNPAGDDGDGAAADAAGAADEGAAAAGDDGEDEAPPAAVSGEDLPTVRVRAGEHAGFSRVVFDWPRPVDYTVGRAGGVLTVRFSAAATADTRLTRDHPLSQIRDVEQTSRGGNLEVAIRTAPDTRVRHYSANNKVVIDVLESGARVPAIAAATVLEPGDAPPPPPPEAFEPARPRDTFALPERPPLPPRGSRPAAAAPPDAPPAAATDVADAAGAAPAAAPPEAGGAGNEAGAEGATVLPADGAAAEDESATAAAAPEPAVPEPAVPEPAVPEPVAPPAAAAAEAPAAEPPIEPAVETATMTDGAGGETEAPAAVVARFDPGIPAAAAVFRRGGGLWVVFAAPGPFDVGRLLAQGREGFRTGTAVPAEGGFAFRFPVARDGWPRVGRDGTAWTVRLEPAPVPPPRPLPVEAQRDFPMGARLFVPAEAADGVVTLTDPTVGDALTVVPLRTAGAGIAERHAYPQVRLPPSAQGAVVVPLSDAVVVRLVEDGIEITADSGLWLSSGADAAAGRRTTDPEAVDRLFDLAAWQGLPGRFEAHRRELQRRIVSGPEDDRERARLDQARFYFSHGYATEALGLLDIVADNRPAVIELPEFRALRGAARVLAGRLDAANEDLSVPPLADSEEAALWRAAAAVDGGDWDTAAAGFRRAGSLRYAYPPPLRQRFLLWAAETWLRQDDPDAAEGELNWLADATDGASERLPAVNYLRGEIALRRGDVQIAERYLRRAAESDDRLYYRLAGTALIDLEREQGRLSAEAEVERLESMRFSWRGDALEFDLLDRLGDAHWRAGSYREAIATWQEAIGLYPDLPAAQARAEDLPERLAALLNGAGDGAEVPPVTALSLFRHHADLLPEGPARDRLAVHLAERLAEVDLLDQAGDLLAGALDDGPAAADDAAGEGLDDAERARVGTRLAAIRLLDDQPEAALTALDRSQTAAAGDGDLLEERRLLRARALSELDDPDAALVLLEPSEGALADAARLDIAWRARDWPLAASVLERMVGEPPALGEPVPDAQAQLVLNQGIALAMTGDAEGLDRLAARFGPAMAESPHANVFALLTRSSTVAEPLEGLAAVRRQVAEIDLFEEFLSGYRGGGTDGALTN